MNDQQLLRYYQRLRGEKDYGWSDSEALNESDLDLASGSSFPISSRFLHLKRGEKDFGWCDSSSSLFGGVVLFSTLGGVTPKP